APPPRQLPLGEHRPPPHVPRLGHRLRYAVPLLRRPPRRIRRTPPPPRQGLPGLPRRIPPPPGGARRRLPRICRRRDGSPLSRGVASRRNGRGRVRGFPGVAGV